MQPNSSSRRLSVTAVSCFLLTALNLYIAWDWFHVEYTIYNGSIEAAFISLAHQIRLAFPDLNWFPYWYSGIPWQNAYPPLLHLTVAAWSALTGLSEAWAYHQVTGTFYALGAVTLYWLVRVLTGRNFPAFLAGLLYSITSLSALFLGYVGKEVEFFEPRRFEVLVAWGEGPHITSMTFLPCAIACLHLAITRRQRRWYALSAVFMAATALSNWLGAFALAAAVLAYIANRGRSVWLAVTGTGLLAYAFAAPWIPPSTIAAIRTNAQIVGNYPMTRVHLLYGAIALGLFALLAWALRRATPAVSFAVLFVYLMAAMNMTREWWNIYLMPQPERYHLEFEMALVVALIVCIDWLARQMTGGQQRALACAALVLCLLPVKPCRRFARHHVVPLAMTQTSAEYKCARWVEQHLPGARVEALGTTSYWLNTWSQNPQFGGGFDQGITNNLIPAVQFQIMSGMNAAPREGEVAIDWLRAFGVSAVIVNGPRSTEAFKPLTNWKKYEGLLPVLWREGDDIVYDIDSAHRSLAHVIPRSSICQKLPLYFIDSEVLHPYLDALTRPAALEWVSRREARIRSTAAGGDVLNIQVNAHPGWKATVNGKPVRIETDKLHFMNIGIPEGPSEVVLRYDGGLEMLLARIACGLAVAVALALLIK